jgi:acetyltransferase-like isoleucine patch superfamily enzyme
MRQAAMTRPRRRRLNLLETSHLHNSSCTSEKLHASRVDKSIPQAGSRWMAWHARLAREQDSLDKSFFLRTAVCDALVRLLPAFALCSTRAWMYRATGCQIERGVTIQGRLLLLSKGPVASRLHIGPGSIVAPWVTFGLDADVYIGRNVSIGPASAFYTAMHAIGFGSRRMQLSMDARCVVVEDGAWIGSHCVILPAVTIGHGSVVAAGAVVTESVPPDSYVEGNPAAVRHVLPFGNR